MTTFANLTLDNGRVLKCYSDGSIEWVCTCSNQHYKKGDVIKSYGSSSTPDGYRCAVINGKTYRVHRLIALAFMPVENSQYLQVDHIDRDKTNNKLSNLRWVTGKENLENTDRHDSSKSKFGVTITENKPEYYRRVNRHRYKIKKNVCFNDGKQHFIANELAEIIYNRRIPVRDRFYNKNFLEDLKNESNIR